MPEELRLIADAMLGRLARWLRLMGFDTLYYRDISDENLIRLALSEGRLILTRDTGFLKRKNLDNILFLSSGSTSGQLAEVVLAAGRDRGGSERCARCNSRLETIPDKKTARGLVPEYVFLNNDSFSVCRECGRIYWEGTQIKKFRAMIRSLLDEGRASG